VVLRHARRERTPANSGHRGLLFVRPGALDPDAVAGGEASSALNRKAGVAGFDIRGQLSFHPAIRAGHRVGATIALGVTTLGLFALPMLFSKKRKHFATVGFKDDQGRPQGLILEFGKNINRSALKTMSLRSGIKIEFESEQAEKEFRH
jgi:hypothetical protein